MAKNNLVDTIRGILGGAQQQAPKVLNQIGSNLAREGLKNYSNAVYAGYNAVSQPFNAVNTAANQALGALPKAFNTFSNMQRVGYTTPRVASPIGEAYTKTFIPDIKVRYTPDRLLSGGGPISLGLGGSGGYSLKEDIGTRLGHLASLPISAATVPFDPTRPLLEKAGVVLQGIGAMQNPINALAGSFAGQVLGEVQSRLDKGRGMTQEENKAAIRSGIDMSAALGPLSKYGEAVLGPITNRFNPTAVNTLSQLGKRVAANSITSGTPFAIYSAMQPAKDDKERFLNAINGYLTATALSSAGPVLGYGLRKLTGQTDMGPYIAPAQTTKAKEQINFTPLEKKLTPEQTDRFRVLQEKVMTGNFSSQYGKQDPVVNDLSKLYKEVTGKELNTQIGNYRGAVTEIQKMVDYSIPQSYPPQTVADQATVKEITDLQARINDAIKRRELSVSMNDLRDLTNLSQHFLTREEMVAASKAGTPIMEYKALTDMLTQKAKSGTLMPADNLADNWYGFTFKKSDLKPEGKVVKADPLTQEARKYKSAEEFESAILGGRVKPDKMKEMGFEFVNSGRIKSPQGMELTDIWNRANQKTQKAAYSIEVPQELKTRANSIDDIIDQGRKQIGVRGDEPNKSAIESAHAFYTQWVDRFHPLTRASGKAKQTLKLKGAELRPEYDPEFLTRRLTGAGGIADYRFKSELEPIIKQVDNLGISKSDLDVYLANKRMAGFGKVGRDVYGVDVKKANRIVAALEQKYGDSIKQVAEPLYKYQDKGLQEMVDAGFISSKDAQAMRGANPDYSPLYRIMDDVNDYLGLPTRKTMQGTQPIMRIKGSDKQIQSPLESIIQNTYSQRAAIEKNRVAQSIVNLQKITDMGFEKVSKSGIDTITVWKDGQKQYWRVGQDIADVAKGADEESMNLILKIIQTPASILRQGATGRNPEFMIPNIIRDQLDASITSKYGYIPFIDYVSGLKSMLKNDDIYKKWQQSGAKISLGELSGKKSISDYVSDKTLKRSLRTWLGDQLDILGKYSEQPTRVGLFKKAYNKTGNDLLSAMESRDATVDFARMGSKMKVANSIIPFLNVGVQGFDKLLRSAKARPGKTLALMATYAVLPQVMSTAYNLQHYPELYGQIPDYEKESNFVLIKGKNADGTVDYLTIPKGNVLPVAANPIQNFVEYLYGQDAESFKEMALNVLSSTLPVIDQGSSIKEIATKTVGSNLPQAIKPITEALVNKSFYKYDPKKEETKDIVPFYLKNKPAYQQAYEFTPQMYQKIGAALNMSPLIVKNTLEGYLAGYTKIPSQIIEMAYKMSKGEQINPNEKPLLRRFLKQTYPTSGKPAPDEQGVPGILERLGVMKPSSGSDVVPLPTDLVDLGYVYEESQKIVDSRENSLKKIRLGITTFDSDYEKKQKIKELQEEQKFAANRIKEVETTNPDAVFDIQSKIYSSDGSSTVVDRAKWVYDTLSKTTNASELSAKVEKLYSANVLTQSVVEELNSKYNTKLTEYVSGGKRKQLKSSRAKKPKKISMGKLRTYKPKAIKIKLAKAKLPKQKRLKLKALTSNKKGFTIKA